MLDLSWPEGSSVNDGILKRMYLGLYINRTYPEIDNLCDLICTAGRGCLVWKRDQKRAYRPVDPRDINILVYSWKIIFYVDRVSPFVLRSAAYVCQRVTNALLYMFYNVYS